MKTIAIIDRSWILVSGFWMLLDFTNSLLIDIQHQVSSIQHLSGKRNRSNILAMLDATVAVT
ncbi:hypothetical protein D1BOALGB6SA_5627 [Olavius sp. associated proteobacterium Delta 1]|nr:hypothetical protein D1BOALGB6SA_5627 [Olavius sp. associated proteobacterium Delta 1]